jgi:hypothetical protein
MNIDILKFLKELDIYKNEGIKGLESGVHPRIIRKLFCSTALWTIYEILKNNENNKNRNQ